MINKQKDDVVARFFKIFNETSHKKRKRFFKEPIIQFYWQKFREQKRELIVSYIANLNKSMRKKFEVDISLMELISGCKISPK